MGEVISKTSGVKRRRGEKKKTSTDLKEEENESWIVSNRTKARRKGNITITIGSRR